MERKFAVQLYTLREELKKDGIRPVFKKLKEMGWQAVQISALPPDYEQMEVAQALKENKLRAAGMHVSLQRLQDDLGSLMDEVDLYGTKDIICPYLSEEWRNEAGYKEVKKLLNKVARQVPQCRISYHNHDFEFNTQVDGQDALSFMLNPANDNKILAEIDVYWVAKAGYNPVSFIADYAKRMPIIHLKDMTNDERKTFAEVGEGTIDFPSILQWGEANGVEWYAVEQDVCERNPFDCLETSLRNLRSMVQRL